MNMSMSRKLLAVLTSLALLLTCASTLAADDKSKDEQRLQESGQVMKDIINIPDDIPQSLLDKADCVIVIPSRSICFCIS